MWRSVTASNSPQSFKWTIIASGVDLYYNIWCFIYDVNLMRIKLHCTVTAEVALCQLCQLGSDYSLHLQGTSDPQWSLSLCKRAMGGEDQSFDCQIKPANNSLTCCYSMSHNHGSGKWWFFKGNYYWRDPFFTSMIMGGIVLLMEEILHHLGYIDLVNNGINYISTGAGFLPSTAKKPSSRFTSFCDDLTISYVGAFFWR